MKRITAVILIGVATLATTVSAKAQSTHSTGDLWRSYAQGMNIGSTVQIRTTDGDRFIGVLMLVDEEAVTVKPRTRYPEASRRIRFDDVDDLQLRTSRPFGAGRAVAVGAAVGGAVFLMLLLALVE